MKITEYPTYIGSGGRAIVDGKTGYEILKMPGCPIKPPKARSMTQAAVDMHSLELSLAKWYITQLTAPTGTKDKT